MKKEEENKHNGIYFRCNFFPKNNGGQVWVETVIYTLIALTMIGAVLAFILPKIEEIRDKSVIDQSINSIKNIDSVIDSVVGGGPGNKRLVETNIKSGKIKIDGIEDKIIFEIETTYIYSEPGKPINLGNVEAITEDIGGLNKVTITADYNYNITYNEIDEEKILEQSSTPYTITIENKGEDGNGNTIINLNIN
ncbi:MAG: hypothetical protein AABX93_00815 [Nanoarchaeota archaeon]